MYYTVVGFERSGQLNGYVGIQLKPTQGPGLDSVRLTSIEAEKIPVGSMVKVELTVLAAAELGGTRVA